MERMKKKGQMQVVGVIIMAMIAVTVAVAMLTGSGGIASNVGMVNDLSTVTNETRTMGVLGGNITLSGKAANSVVVTNATGGEIVPATNYTVTNYVLQTDGTLAPVLRANAGPYVSKSVNISYIAEPDTYANEAGTRTVTELIILLSALALACIVMGYLFKEQIKDMLDL